MCNIMNKQFEKKENKIIWIGLYVDNGKCVVHNLNGDSVTEITTWEDVLRRVLEGEYIYKADLNRIEGMFSISEMLNRLKVNPSLKLQFRAKLDKEYEWCVADIKAKKNAEKHINEIRIDVSSQNIFRLCDKEEKFSDKAPKADSVLLRNCHNKPEFLVNIAHDMRTPMNSVLGYTRLLQKYQDEPGKRTEYFKKLEESSVALLSVINNALEMARIEEKTLQLDEKALSVWKLNDSMFYEYHNLMKTKGIEFTRQITVEHPYVFCDYIKVQEIFVNIFSNAYRYTNPGGRVSMRLQELPCDIEDYVLYQTEITDTGIGMSEEFLPKIFDAFSRENNKSYSIADSVGLGMTIVKHMLDAMGGIIEVESKKDVGTKVTVTIPHRIAEESDLDDTLDVTLDNGKFKGKRILIAEDNDYNAEITATILAEAGFVTERAEDGKKCVEMLKNSEDGHYDLVLMDIQMPNMDGYEATREIRAMSDNSKSNIHILALTANAFEEDKKDAILAGMNGHIEKPINIEKLMNILAGMIR